MTVDYTFGQQYSVTSNNSHTSGGVSFLRNAVDISNRLLYGRTGSDAVLHRFSFATRTITSLGALSGFSGTLQWFDIDEPNQLLYAVNNATPFVLYKYNLNNLAAGATTVIGAGAARSVAVSRTSGTIAVATTSGTRFYNSSLSLLNTGINSFSCVWDAISNKFVVIQSNSVNIRFYNSSGVETGTAITTSNLSSSQTALFYSYESQLTYNTSSSEIQVINGSSQTISSSYSYSGFSSSYGSVYIKKVNQIYIGANNTAFFIDPESGQQTAVNATTTDLVNTSSTAIEPNTTDLLIFGTNKYLLVDTSSYSSTLLAANSLTIPAITSSPSDQVYFPSNGNARINAIINFFRLDRWLSSAASSSTEYNFNWIRSTNTTATCGSNLEFSGNAEITGDFTITMGASTTLTLGTRSNYTERFIIPSTGTILVRNDVTLTGFTFSAGTTINRVSGVTDPVTVTLLSNPGVIAGTGVTIAAPEVEITLTGLVVGSEVRIYESGTTNEIAGVETSGTIFTFTPGSVVAIDISILSDNYQNLRISNFATPSSDTTIPISQVTDRNYENQQP